MIKTLKQHIKDLGMSQAEFARKIDKSRQHVNEMIRHGYMVKDGWIYVPQRKVINISNVMKKT